MASATFSTTTSVHVRLHQAEEEHERAKTVRTALFPLLEIASNSCGSSLVNVTLYRGAILPNHQCFRRVFFLFIVRFLARLAPEVDAFNRRFSRYRGTVRECLIPFWFRNAVISFRLNPIPVGINPRLPGIRKLSSSSLATV